jgi:hypothetical protein
MSGAEGLVGRPRRTAYVEEGPGSPGQGGGQHPPGAIRGTVPQRTNRRRLRTAVRVKRWCKRPPAARATGPAWQTPPGARSNSARPRAARPSARVDRTRPPATAVRDGWPPNGTPQGAREQNPAYRPAPPPQASDLHVPAQRPSPILRVVRTADGRCGNTLRSPWPRGLVGPSVGTSRSPVGPPFTGRGLGALSTPTHPSPGRRSKWFGRDDRDARRWESRRAFSFPRKRPLVPDPGDLTRILASAATAGRSSPRSAGDTACRGAG